MSAIPELERLRPEEQEFKATQSYIAMPWLETKEIDN